MIPCFSLFLEVEIPDPSLEYFIISQDELDNDEHLLAPPPFGTPTGLMMGDRDTKIVLPEEEEALVLWDDEDTYFAFKKQANGKIIDWRWNETENRYEYFGECVWDIGPNSEAGRWKPEPEDVVVLGEYQQGAIWDEQHWKGNQQPDNQPRSHEFFFAGDIPEDTEIPYQIIYHWLSGPLGGETVTKMAYITVPSINNPTEIPEQPEQPDAIDRNPPPDPEPEPEPGEPCEDSGLNTFVLNTSCLDGEVDLLEGWGAAKPDYKWVDVITDSTDITISRGFDMKQGIVGTPIAGILEANVLDPYLDGIQTQMVAVGQRVRLRAGRNIVFSGVCSSVRSDYDAVNTPTLRIEAVDALGLLNAQMVSERPQEGYNTRIAEAASKVELPIIQQTSTTVLEPTEDAMSALELLVETQDSEGSVVWLDRFGTMYSTNRYWLDNLDMPMRGSRFSDAPRFTFTNNPKDEIGIYTTEQVCLSAYRQVADTSQVINGITFYNYTEVEEEGTDENGDPITENVIVRDTFTYESGTSRRLYGDAGVKLTTYLPPNELPAFADYIFDNYDTPRTKVETIQFPLDKWTSLEVPETVTIDIGDPMIVRIDDPNTQHTLQTAIQRVAQIRHQITPTEWLCELDLL